MSSEAAASSKSGRGSEAKTESVNTPLNTILAPASNTPTTPSTDTTSSTEVSAEPPKPAGRRKTTPQSLMMGDILRSLRRLSTQIEQLSDMIGGLELHPEDNNTDASTPSFSILKKGDRNRGPVGRRSSKVSSGGQFGGPWKPLVVATHRNLEIVPSLDVIDLQEATLKCLYHDGTHELVLSKSIMGPLIAGEDILLQIRSSLLDDYVSYALVDIVSERAKPELCAVIIVTRFEITSTKRLLDTLAKKFEVAKLHVNQYIIERTYDLGPLSKAAPNKPRIYVTTPDMLPKLKEANLLDPDHTHVMVIYEAEYVMRNPRMVQSIKSVLEKMKVAQAILAVREVTDDVLHATGTLDFKADAVHYSIDHEHMKNANNFYFSEPSLEEVVLNRAAELSMEYPVVVLGNDIGDIARLKEIIGAKAHLIPDTAVLGPDMLPHGMFVAPYSARFFFVGKPRTGVRLIISLSQSPVTLERYLATMATYMDVGETCNIVFKINSHADVPKLKAVANEAREITNKVPF
ncbi:hypothetical protein BG006_007919 [Podila minutissima]|uniref:Uncharacterized protein n=1 Tax=Podila minutissima TaxID=64525 RepID=A0A9P5SGV9_9FUNG|nr:hypothetical protein BG006_007919 [Podila minutissima]